MFRVALAYIDNTYSEYTLTSCPRHGLPIVMEVIDLRSVGYPSKCCFQIGDVVVLVVSIVQVNPCHSYLLLQYINCDIVSERYYTNVFEHKFH